MPYSLSVPRTLDPTLDDDSVRSKFPWPLPPGQSAWYSPFSPFKDPLDSSSYMVSSFHYSPSYSAYRTQKATGEESGPSWRPTTDFKFAGGHGQDVNSTGLSAYTQATPRELSFDSSSNPVDGTLTRPAPEPSDSRYRYTICGADYASMQSVRRHQPEVHEASSEKAGSKEAAKVAEICPFPGCKMKCGRFQDFDRHILDRHLPPHLYCKQPGCDFTSSRFYLLMRHHHDKHPGVPMPEHGFTIYDAKVLAKQVRTKEIGIEQAVHVACSLFEEKAKQMGKLGI